MDRKPAQAQIYHIDLEFAIETICYIGTSKIDKHIFNFQWQTQEFHIRMLKVRVKGQEVMLREE